MGMAATQVDGILGAGTDAFVKETSTMQRALESKTRAYAHLSFSMVTITPGGDRGYRLDQPSYPYTFNYCPQMPHTMRFAL